MAEENKECVWKKMMKADLTEVYVKCIFFFVKNNVQWIVARIISIAQI